MKKRFFSKEMKREAVRMVKGGQRPAAQITRDLGIQPALLYDWVKKFKDAAEAILGGNLPASFPVIDAYADGVVTSIKSIDLTASSYQLGSSLYSKLNQYLTSLYNFDGATWGGTSVGNAANPTDSKVLNIAIQQGVEPTAAQSAAMAQIVQQGASEGITVTFTPVK